MPGELGRHAPQALLASACALAMTSGVPVRVMGDETRFSASDLANHLGCQQLTWLNEAAACREIAPQVWNDPMLEIIHKWSFEYEAQSSTRHSTSTRIGLGD